MNEELIEHEIVIDEYMTATLKIPKVLTAMELAALMAKAKKMFNISDAQTEQQHSVKRMETRNYVAVKLTTEQEKELIRDYDINLSNEEKDEIAEKYGIATRQKLYSKYQNLKTKHKIKGTKKGKIYRGFWTEKREQQLIAMYNSNSNLSGTGMAKKLGASSKQVYDKLYTLKKRGDIK